MLFLADKPMNSATVTYTDIIQKSDKPKFISDEEIQSFINKEDVDVLEYLKMM